MNIRETLTHLIDRHGEALRLSRRSLADEARVNPGQVSNWLRNDGPIAPDKQGALAEVALERVQEYLHRQPDAPIKTTLLSFRSRLVDYGPRLRRIAALPEAALAGGSISRENPFYVKRSADMDLEDRLQRDLIRIGISGGPKTGKSSLLWAAEEILEPSREVLRVDFTHYEPLESRDPSTAVTHLCAWIQRKCEEQVSGPAPTFFESPCQMSRWVSSNLLPNSRNGKCVLLFDNIGSLHREGWGQAGGGERVLIHGFQETVALLGHQTGRNQALRRFGMICAFDPSEKAFQDCGKDGIGPELSGLSVAAPDPFQGNQVGQIMAARGSYELDPSLRQEIFEKVGGHPFMTQVLCAAAMETNGDLDAALERGRAILSTAIRSRWSAERIEFASRAIAPDSSPVPINGRGVWDLIHSGIAAEGEMDLLGNIKFKPRVKGLESALRI